MSRHNAVLLIVLLGMTACAGGKDSASEEAGRAEAGTLSVAPDFGGLGTDLELRLEGTSSMLAYGATSVDLGEGIVVNGVDVDSGFGGRAQITIAEDAALGPRDVTVVSEDQSYLLPGAFTVVAESFRIEPDAGRMGETLAIDFLGKNTAWAPGVSWPDFGEGVTVRDFTVLTDNLATATVTVDIDAAPGWRDVTVDNGGGERVTNWQGFKIDRVGLAATFDPPIAEQGDTVEFTIQARGTDFLSATPRLRFDDRFGPNADIVVDSVTVLDSENLYGRMTLSNAAALGGRDVQLTVGDEGVAIPEAFEVIGGGWDVSNVAIDLSFTVVRVRDNNTGEIDERVRASCTFYIPLDPPCPQPQETSCADGVDNDFDSWIDCSDQDCIDIGACPSAGSPPSGSEPDLYDLNGVIVYPSSDGAEVGDGPDDCPFPQTVPAGEYVWLESEANVITMVRTYDPESGTVSYVAEGLTMADYVPDNWYDLHTQGQPDGIGEYVIPRVQPTVPSDWEWLAPNLWSNYTHNRARPFTFEWTPAGTYPDAIFVFSIFNSQEMGPMEGGSGWGGAYPMDDGAHTMSAAEMSLFSPGVVPVYTYSFVQGPEFGLPDSIYQTNRAPSYIYLVQQMVLE